MITIDFETYSEAGFNWSDELDKWVKIRPSQKKGLALVGTRAYVEHPSTEVLCLGIHFSATEQALWIPGAPPPTRLFEAIRDGELIEAWNSGFEWQVWNWVCRRLYGWPALPLEQMRCAMAKARAYSLPGALGEAAKVLQLKNQKNEMGTALLSRFSFPRNPTQKDRRRRIHPAEDPKGPLLYQYCLEDVAAEVEASSRIPDLSPLELQVWLADQRINARGVQIDTDSVANMISVVEQAYGTYNAEFQALTGIDSPSKVKQTLEWMQDGYGVIAGALAEEDVTELLSRPALPHPVKRALEIRQALGSAAVKKLWALRDQVSSEGRMCNMYIYHSARTGRAAGADVQPQNLVSAGPDTYQCKGCGAYYGVHHSACPACFSSDRTAVEWSVEVVNQVLTLCRGRDFKIIEYYFGPSLSVLAGCLRGLFTAGPGQDIVSADYTSIEAVVAAALAGEEWRLDVFRRKGDIYVSSASKIFKIPETEFYDYKKSTGKHHPLRKKGKVAELASGYQGWINAWRAFGAEGEDDEIKQQILEWRRSSPAIVEMWGGQYRGYGKNRREEMYGLEGKAVSAVIHPGTTYAYRSISYCYDPVADVLFCTLPSGRQLKYHTPRLSASDRGGLALSYYGWNTNPKQGPIGWIKIWTHGGKLFENIVQAVSRDIFMYAILKLEAAGYPVIMHTHDEPASEIPQSYPERALEEYQAIMQDLPAWAAGWPIGTGGAWRGHRNRK